MSTMKPSPDDEGIVWASDDAKRAQRIIDLYQAHQQPDMSQLLPMLDQMQHGGSVEIDAMNLADLRAHAQKLLALVTHLSRMLAHGDVNRVALGLQDNERALQAAGIISKLGAQTHKARDDRKKGAARKLAKDPKQAAKKEATKLWQERYDGKHPKLGTNEQFATECMRRWPVLKSAKVILGWCTKWTKAAKSQRAS
jgi:hypothetical protein